MKLTVDVVEPHMKKEGYDHFLTLKNGKGCYAELDGAAYRLGLNKGCTLYLFGDVFYHMEDISNIRIIGPDDEGYLAKIFDQCPLNQVICSTEGQFIGIHIDPRKAQFRIFGDRYARHDLFYAHDGSNGYFSTDLEEIFQRIDPEYDQDMLAHFFSTYGWYTPRGFTIYKNVQQLRVGETIGVSDAGFRSEFIEFEPLDIEDYGEEKLEDYYRILRESVVARSSHKGKTWVSSSSGWDSSLLLAILVDELGAENVGMLTGKMEYSKNTDLINKFEIDKINKISGYFGIEPEFVSLDFKNKNAPDLWIEALPFFKSRHMYSYTSYSTAKLAAGLGEFGSHQVILNGETSDSFHNFGFSQFGTFFHNEKPFTEYADKMNCYLYGPTFFEKVLAGDYETDKVFQIFTRMMEKTEFATGLQGKDRINAYLFPLFLGGPRLPFAKTYLNPLLTEGAQQSLYALPFKIYMPKILSDCTPQNIYSWLIYLYHSFHSQGSTAKTRNHAMERSFHKWRSPYYDLRLVEFLSKAPESWGRGLDFNHTKYPLKWVAKNKIPFPYDLLNTGPHSYLYDVIEGFSLIAEITYRSGVTDFFKDTLRSKPYHAVLSGDTFRIPYLDGLVDDYLSGKEASGPDLNSLVSLITFCITGWY